MYVVVEDVHLVSVSITNMDMLDAISKARVEGCSLSAWLPGLYTSSVFVDLGMEHGPNSCCSSGLKIEMAYYYIMIQIINIVPCIITTRKSKY